MERYQCSDLINKLTKVSMIINTDGVHTSEELIGYIAEDPFVVFTILINKYAISYYNERIYPMALCSFSNSLKIEDCGSIYSYNNMDKRYFNNIDSFISIEDDVLIKARLTEDKRTEEFTLFANILSNEDLKCNHLTISLQKAIDLQDFAEMKFEWDQDYNINRVMRNIMTKISSFEFGQDYETDMMISYVIKQCLTAHWDHIERNGKAITEMGG